jgi:hypothetical protein
VGLGLERTGRGERGLVIRRVGLLALVFAASGWVFLWFAISRANVFCGGGPDDCPSLLGEAPRYLAILGMLAPATAISFVLDRYRAAPRFLSVSAILLSLVALASAIAMTIAAYDFMLSSIGSGRLDAPDRMPAVPAVVQRFGALWPVFSAGWMTLTSLLLVRHALPVAIAGLGVVAGIAIVVTIPFASEWFVNSSILPLELILSLVWATSVGIYLLAASRDDQQSVTAGNFQAPRAS